MNIVLSPIPYQPPHNSSPSLPLLPHLPPLVLSLIPLPPLLVFSRVCIAQLITTLHKILKPFLMRRLKKDVTTLPPKREVVLYTQLSEIQKHLYVQRETERQGDKGTERERQRERERERKT